LKKNTSGQENEIKVHRTVAENIEILLAKRSQHSVGIIIIIIIIINIIYSRILLGCDAA
jgi:hypothetical protein